MDNIIDFAKKIGNMQPISPIDRDAPRRRPRASPVMFQRWTDLLFLHWQVPAESLQPTLPQGLHLDLYEGNAYVGIVPFFMQAIRPRFLPAVPCLSYFLELNVRTYVHDDQGRPGVWFYSLDTNRWLAYRVARTAFKLPYQLAEMSMERDAGWTDYRTRRKGESAESRFRYRSSGEGATAVPGSLEFFLLERYVLFTESAPDQIRLGRVHHSPYRYADAETSHFDTHPLEWNHLPLAINRPPDHQCVAEDVQVEVFPLESASS